MSDGSEVILAVEMSKLAEIVSRTLDRLIKTQAALDRHQREIDSLHLELSLRKERFPNEH